MYVREGERKRKGPIVRRVKSRILSLSLRQCHISHHVANGVASERANEDDRVPGSSSRVGCGLGGRQRRQVRAGGEARTGVCRRVARHGTRACDPLLLIYFIYSRCVACAWQLTFSGFFFLDSLDFFFFVRRSSFTSNQFIVIVLLFSLSFFFSKGNNVRARAHNTVMVRSPPPSR